MKPGRNSASIDVVVIGSMWWSGHQLTDQRVATALAQLGQRVVYVNPAFAPIASSRQTRQGRPDSLGSETVGDGLEVFSPLGIPLRSRPVIASVNSWLTATQIIVRYAFRLRRNTRVLAFTAHPSLMAALRPWRRVAVVKDDYVSGADLIDQKSHVVLRRRRLMLTRASAVITVSRPLAQSLLKQGFASTLITPGATVVASASLSDELDGIKRPRALFSGLISDRIDLDVLQAVAGTGWSLVLVGGTQPTFERHEELERLLVRTNVTQLGWRSPDELHAIAWHCNAGLLPYTLSAFNRASSPLKTMEYLAAGLPVVATALPSVLDLGSPDVHVISGPEDVSPLLDQLAAEGDNEQGNRRRADFAADNSWTARARDYLEVLNP